VRDRGDDQRKLDSLTKGFMFLCDEAGLEIHVIDYHAEPLKLSWETLDEWRAESTRQQLALPLQGTTTPPSPPSQGPSPGFPRKERRRRPRSKPPR